MIFFSLCFNLTNFCNFKKCYKSFILLDKKGSVSFLHIKEPLKLFIYKQFLSATMFSNIVNTYKKHLLINFKQLLLNKISLFSAGCKDQIVVKGLGFRCSFITIKNRLFLIFKLNYSHKITVPIQFEIYSLLGHDSWWRLLNMVLNARGHQQTQKRGTKADKFTNYKWLRTPNEITHH